ncbi:MAG TPA: putative lipid II flippase FtsW [Candidatus Saccharimonadales bacterium]|nr:putative lipid II flippase FtsW [Candidatus Saccharimonadales bacterium]
MKLPFRRPAPPMGTARLRGDEHQPDVAILLSVVALAAIGILMVYSSSALQAYVKYDGDTFKTVGPQLVWGLLGLVAMLVMMRVDYRWLRIVSVPMYVAAIGLLVIVLVPGFGISVGGSARWLQVGPLPAVNPAEFAKLAMIVYLAHWFAKRGPRVREFWAGTVTFIVIFAPALLLVLHEPDLGTSAVIGLTAATMFFVAGANLAHLLAMTGAGVGLVVFVVSRTPYQLDRVRALLDPWADPQGIGFHTIQGLLALGLGGILGAGLGESKLAGGLFLPNASNDFIFAIIGEEFGLIGATVVVLLFLTIGYRGFRIALSAPDTFGALLAAGITTGLCVQAFINIGVVVALLPITGITLPFISAGGSSLTISFAAVGILLSISRETVERGTWNDAAADRGGGHGRTHLPGSRRRAIAPGGVGRA